MIEEAPPPSGPDAPRADRSVTPEGLRARIRRHRDERPPLGRAIRADGVRFAAMRAERFEFSSRRGEWLNAARLLFASDDFAGVVLYRLRMWLHDAGAPVLPWILHRLCILFFGIRIVDNVLIREGVYIPHGNIVIDGVIEIGGGCTICPWVTIGLKQGSFVGPRIDGNVFIGTGARVLGDVHVGASANIGAGAVVVGDVPAGATAAGVPARVREASG
jgi:serine O-acetyltransferase